jgi:hypothetical protein
MSDIDIFMPTFINQKSSSSSTVSTSSSSRINLLPSRSFFLAQQAKLSINEESSSDVKVSWVDASTEAERIRQNQLHNLDEMTQVDDDY